MICGDTAAWARLVTTEAGGGQLGGRQLGGRQLGGGQLGGGQLGGGCKRNPGVLQALLVQALGKIAANR